MAKGYQENKDRKEAIGRFGKSIGKRAGFKCEWCESKDELRVHGRNAGQEACYDHRPAQGLGHGGQEPEIQPEADKAGRSYSRLMTMNWQVYIVNRHSKTSVHEIRAAVLRNLRGPLVIDENSAKKIFTYRNTSHFQI